MSTRTTETRFGADADLTGRAAKVELLAPLRWLGRGVSDFRRIPALSLLYGTLFAVLCAGFYALSGDYPWLILGFLTGLVVVGPFLASGLYVASRDLEQGMTPSIARSLRLLAQRKTYLALFSLMLALIMAAWVRFSALVFALKFNTLSPTIEAYTNLVSSADGWIALGYFGGIGFLLVTVVFVFSAFAIPLIVDKDSDFISAMRISFRNVKRNPGSMFVWAAIIASLTVIGVATAFVGLAIVFPILGYATWHSYRDVVE